MDGAPLALALILSYVLLVWLAALVVGLVVPYWDAEDVLIASVFAPVGITIAVAIALHRWARRATLWEYLRRLNAGRECDIHGAYHFQDGRLQLWWRESQHA